MTKRIALVRQRYNAAGGAERFVARALAGLRRQGADVTLLARRWHASPDIGRVVLLDPFYVGRTWRDWSFARAVRAHVAHDRYDLVQSHERMPWCDIYRAGDGVHREWLLQRARVLSGPQRAALWANPYHRYLLAQESRIFGAAGPRCVVCISRMVRDEVIRHYGTAESRLRVIYLGVDLDRYHPQARERLRAVQRTALGIGEDELAVLHVGSGFERKGLATLLRAVALEGSCRLIVVGSDKHEARYRALARTLGIAARVHFAGVQSDPLPYYAAADVAAMPSLYEPFGNANMEALAMGLPVLASTKSGVAELLEPGVTGFVHDALDAEAFAGSLGRLREFALRQSMSAAARTLAEGYSLDAMARQLLALYEELLSTR